MYIYSEMDLSELAARMGGEPTIHEVWAMRSILCGHHYDQDTQDIPDDLWEKYLETCIDPRSKG